MLAEISKDFTWTKRFLGVGETRMRAPCGPNFIGVKCYPFTLYWSTRAKEGFRTSWGFWMAQFDR